MISASLLVTGALLFGPPSGDRPTPVLAPTQPQPGEPAIAPAEIDAERAGPEPMPAQPGELEPEPATIEQPEPTPEAEPGDTLPSWQEGPSVEPDPGDTTPIADWTTPIAPDLVAPEIKEAPAKGWGLVGAAGGVFGGMVVTQLITGFRCEADVYCGTRGWPWRLFGIGTMGLAGGGGWMQGKRVAWDRAEAGSPVKNPIGRRAGGWAMFVLGLGGLITDAALYQLCYDGRRGPYIEIDGFRYTCSPVISVVTLDLSTLVGATGLGLALSAESQLRNRKRFDLSVAPWGGRGQAGLSVAGRF
jgi:hypothetical protein